MDPYLVVCEEARKANGNLPKPLNVIVLTNGKFHNDVGLVLGDVGRRLDHLEAYWWQIGVQFVQVGEMDEQGTIFPLMQPPK